MVRCILTTKGDRCFKSGNAFQLILGSFEPANGYPQKNCAERFSALHDTSIIFLNINYFERKVASLKLRQMNAMIESCVFSFKKKAITDYKI